MGIQKRQGQDGRWWGHSTGSSDDQPLVYRLKLYRWHQLILVSWGMDTALALFPGKLSNLPVPVPRSTPSTGAQLFFKTGWALSDSSQPTREELLLSPPTLAVTFSSHFPSFHCCMNQLNLLIQSVRKAVWKAPNTKPKPPNPRVSALLVSWIGSMGDERNSNIRE